MTTTHAPLDPAERRHLACVMAAGRLLDDDLEAAENIIRLYRQRTAEDAEATS